MVDHDLWILPKFIRVALDGQICSSYFLRFSDGKAICDPASKQFRFSFPSVSSLDLHSQSSEETCVASSNRDVVAEAEENSVVTGLWDYINSKT